MSATGRVPAWAPAALSGALLALSFPGSGDQTWLVFAALVPLLFAIERAPWRRAATLGFLAGLVFWLATIPWLALTLVRYGDAPWPLAVLATLGLASYLALYAAAFCALLASGCRAGAVLHVVVAAAIWVALELVRTYLFTGFPWNLLGYSQYRNLPLIQVASVTGVYGVSFVVVAVNAALAPLLRIDRRWTERLASLGAGGLALVLALGTGWLVASPPSGAEAVPVAVVQGNIDQGRKWDPASRDATLAAYRTLTLDAARLRPALIAWPETALPILARDDPAWRDVEDLARRAGAHLVVGAPDWQRGRFRNSVFFLTPAGRTVGRYDKRHLVPFGEYVPLQRILFFVDVVAGGTVGAFVPGTEATVFSTPAGRVAVVICFEAIFPGEVRELFRDGAELLVNVTNDAWFGRSAAPVQHLAAAVFRAVENRAYLVRAANTGISAIVAPDGRIVRSSGLFTPAVLSASVTRRAGPGLYTRYGDVFAWAAVGIAIGALWPSTSRGRRKVANHLAAGRESTPSQPTV